MKKTFLASLLSFSLFFVIGATFVLAQEGGIDKSGQGGIDKSGQGGIDKSSDCNSTICFTNPFSGADNLFDLLKKVINDILLPVGAVLCVLAFIYSGFLYVTAQGDEKKISTAHSALLYSAIGTALLLGAWVFAGAICKTMELISDKTFCPPN